MWRFYNNYIKVICDNVNKWIDDCKTINSSEDATDQETYITKTKKD